MNNKKILKEACISTIEEAQYFIKKKVDRFETCYDLSKGGLTPKTELFQYIKNNSDIHQVIMIRTNDNFSVNEKELNLMIDQIKNLKELGATEFIFGFINENNEIDVKACKELITYLEGCKYDFHMAIDTLNNYKRDIPILIEMGFNRILTKGGNLPAIENIDSINKIIEEFGDKIEILIGGSVTKDNLDSIASLTKATQFHGTKIL